MASSDELRWTSLAEVTKAVSAFLNPVLASADFETWEPEGWLWKPRQKWPAAPP
jgi:hypothetical protein